MSLRPLLRTFTTSPNAPKTKNVGLYGMSKILTLSDISKTSESSKIAVQNLVNTLKSPPSTSSPLTPLTTLRRLDEISRIICLTIDPSELLRNTHHSPNYRTSACSTFTEIGNLIDGLNADVGIYDVAKNLEGGVGEGWGKEERRMLKAVVREYEMDGINLPTSSRNLAQSLKGMITVLETSYTSNAGEGEFFKYHDPAGMGGRIFGDGVEGGIREAYVGGGGDLRDGETVGVTERWYCNNVIRYSGEERVRKEVYRALNSSGKRNIEVLEDMRRRRGELSRVLGYRDYVEKVGKGKMAEGRVEFFLKRKKRKGEGRWKKEMEMLGDVKRKWISGGNNGRVEPWDLEFLQYVWDEKEGGREMEEGGWRGTVGEGLERIKLWTKEFLGMRLEVRDFEEGEGWVEGNRGLVKTVLVDVERDGEEVGVIYFDLMPREGKYGHSAHFTIEGGYELWTPDYTSVRGRSVPRVAVVMNVGGGTGEERVGEGELETMFHEYGHALHAVMSRTKYQHLSGTRGPTDFVEVVSHVVEKHAGKKPGRWEGIENYNQIMYAEFDRRIFSADGEGRTSLEIFADLNAEFGVPYMEGTHWFTNFGHLSSYGGVYYSYLWAKEVADVINERIMGQGVEGRRESFRKLVEPGGSEEPIKIVENVMGKKWEGIKID